MILDYSAANFLGTQLHTADTFNPQSQPSTRDVDALIIGAGPSGLVVAMILAEAGMDVVVVEDGRFWQHDQFRRRQSWAAEHLMQEQAARVMSGNAFIPVASGRGVGGGTLVNSAICFRGPDPVLNEWARDWGLDYFSESQRDPLFEEVESTIGVAPTPPDIAGENSFIAQRGFQAMGLRADFMPRNAPGCVGCGTCQTGCPSGGKATADLTWLPRFLRAGGHLFADTRAESLTVTQNRREVTGATCILRTPGDPSSASTLTFRTNRVILAAGAINTPLLLLRQELANSSGQVGRNLHVHPTCGVVARFDHEVRLWSGATQGFYAYHPDDPEVLLETFSASPDIFLSQIARVGHTSAGDFLRNFKHLAGTGLLIRDSSSGTIRPGTDNTARITYHLNRPDLQKIQLGLHTLVDMFYAAGSRAIMPMVRNSSYFRSANRAKTQITRSTQPKDYSLYASHPMGSCRIGDDPRRAVARPTDGRCHDTRGLYIVDSSLFPTSLGANPQVTIMAQALALGRRIAASEP